MQRHRATRFGASLAVLLAFVAGCYPSENPIWTPDTLVYYPEILGTYQEGELAAEKDTTTLEKGEAEKSYRVTSRNGKGEKLEDGVLHLAKLGETLFYDYQPTAAKLGKVDPPNKPFHVFGRLTIEGKKVTLYSFGDDVAVDKVFRLGKADPEKKNDRAIVNTTAELQAILKANAAKMNVRGDEFTKIRD
jgi:hypothetical protein